MAPLYGRRVRRLPLLQLRGQAGGGGHRPAPTGRGKAAAVPGCMASRARRSLDDCARAGDRAQCGSRGVPRPQGDGSVARTGITASARYRGAAARQAGHSGLAARDPEGGRGWIREPANLGRPRGGQRVCSRSPRRREGPRSTGRTRGPASTRARPLASHVHSKSCTNDSRPCPQVTRGGRRAGAAGGLGGGTDSGRGRARSRAAARLERDPWERPWARARFDAARPWACPGP